MSLHDPLDVADPDESERIALNIRFMEDFRAGRKVRYRGPIRKLDGQMATVLPGVDPVDGLDIEFYFPDPRFPEYATLHVDDFRELVPGGED